MSSYSEWEFHTGHVDTSFKGGQFASAETTMIAAGPPRLKQARGAGQSSGTVYPIGMLENFSVSQSKQIQRIFEIGSGRSYFIPGRVVGQTSLGRVFYYGPSLLRVIYAYYAKDNASDPGARIHVGTANETLDPHANLLSLSELQEISLHQIKNPAGDGNFYINLASDMFNQGTGLATYMKDSNDNLIGAMYLEDCYVTSHQMNISSGSVLIMEGASMQFDRVVPIRAVV
jgi:hypothetical protein